MNATPRTIQFKLPWRGRQIGQRDSLLDPGVMQELVRTNRAVFIDGAGLVPTVTLGDSAPGATATATVIQPKRGKKRKDGATD